MTSMNLVARFGIHYTEPGKTGAVWCLYLVDKQHLAAFETGTWFKKMAVSQIALDLTNKKIIKNNRPHVESALWLEQAISNTVKDLKEIHADISEYSAT